MTTADDADPVDADPADAVPADAVRTFAPVDPGRRPRRLRRTARVLLIDDRDRLLLFADSDPGIPGSRWWITPGGGVEPGESDREAAVRELLEETGAVVAEDALIGPVARRRAVHGYTDVIVEQDEVFFGAAVPAFDVSVAGHTEEEKLTLGGFRWWSGEELAGTDEPIWPGSILQLWEHLRAALTGGIPLPMLELGRQEESTVPAGTSDTEP